MAAKSKIAWCDATWNPITGCTQISEGCRNCYAMKHTARMVRLGIKKYEAGFDKVVCHTDAKSLSEPLKWKKAKRIFVGSMADLFHRDVPTDYIQKIFDIMRNASWHTLIVCTKRAERLAEITDWPANVWAGVTVENDHHLDRIEHLKATGAAVKWISMEPLLGPMPAMDLSGIDWVVVAGESGSGARQMQQQWVLDIREQVKDAGLAFFFKQWGTFKGGNNPLGKADPTDRKNGGEAKGGMTLDGKLWLEWPEPKPLMGTPSQPKPRHRRRLMSTCVHEAAHALAAIFCGAHLDLINVDGDVENPPHVSFRHSESTAPHVIGTVYAAGAVASARYSRTSTAAALLGGGYSDLLLLRESVPDLDEQLKAVAAAELVVRESWAAIKLLADELRRRGQMTMAEVRQWVEERKCEAEECA